MDRNIVPAILGTVCCFLSTITIINHLSPYIITSLDEVGFILSKAWNVLTNDYPEKYWFIFSLLLAIIGAVVSWLIILYLVNYLSTKNSSEDSLGLSIKIILIAWIILLGANILISVYYLLFIILFLIALCILLFIIATGPNYNGGSGSVYVRGHTRKGTYVRSYYRRRPRRF